MIRQSAIKTILLPVLMAFFAGNSYSQSTHELFQKLPLDTMGVRCYEILCTKGGSVRLTTSIGMWKLKGRQMDWSGPPTGEMTDNITGKKSFMKDPRSMAEDSIRAMAEGPDSIFFYASHDNLLTYSPISDIPALGWPPFVFPPKGKPFDRVSCLYIDNSGDLFIGTHADNFYWIKEGANKQSYKNVHSKVVDSVITVVNGEKTVKKIILSTHTGVFSFAQDSTDKNIIWIGTNHGLYSYNKSTAESKAVVPVNTITNAPFTVTHIETDKQSNLWFSTLENGMGFYYRKKNSIQFYPYPKKNTTAGAVYPIKTFCYKSDNDFFVAVMDSVPAIFNKKSGLYTFINDPSLNKSANRTTDIKVDKLGNLFVIKGGTLYLCNASENNMLAAAIKPDSSLLAPFIRSVALRSGEEIASINYNYELLKELTLKYDQNSFIIYYDLNDLSDKSKIQFAWKMETVTNGWVVMPMFNFDSANMVFIQDLKPGTYLFELKVKVGTEDWRKQQAKMTVIIMPPFWQTWWFWLSVMVLLFLLIFVIVKLRVRTVRNTERLKAKHEKELLELEAKALRAQMNPHFIFNCLNSIKSLIQEHEEDKAITYLTTFSKLIRTLFLNADKKEISLFDEIETCRFYLQLEAMRFDTKFTWSVTIDEGLDLKSIAVPALVVQPFIENAVWHGIVPGGSGGHVNVLVQRKNNDVEVIIADNGIGRETSKQNKPSSSLTHQSKGVNLTASRLELDSMLKQRQAAMEIIDKKNEDGGSAGTTVIIKFKDQLS
jgi:anti-sigma regulatory factor (Ser/Thr protein kinase)